jgi:hypothetical protein
MGSGLSLSTQYNSFPIAEKYVSLGYSKETVSFVSKELKKPADARDLVSSSDQLKEVALLRKKIRELYDVGVKEGTIVRRDDGRLPQYNPKDYRADFDGKDAQTIDAELNNATSVQAEYYKDDPDGPDNTQWHIPPLGHEFAPPQSYHTKQMSLKDMFQTFDTNKDGEISGREWLDALNGLGIEFSDKDAKSVMARLDEDSDGSLSLEEFVTFVEDLGKPEGKMIEPTAPQEENDEEHRLYKHNLDASAQVQERLYDIIKNAEQGRGFKEHVRTVWHSLNEARATKESLLEEKEQLVHASKLNGEVDYQVPIRLTQELENSDNHISVMERKYYRASATPIHPPQYEFNDSPSNEVNVVYVGEDENENIGAVAYEDEEQGSTDPSRRFYDIFLIRQTVILPRSPPRQSNLDTEEAFVVVPEETDQYNEINAYTKEKLADDIFVLVADENVDEMKLTLPSVLLPSDFRLALPELRKLLMARWNLDATCLRYMHNADGNGRRILEMELHDNLWEPKMRTAHLRWETLEDLKEAHMSDVHSQLIWNYRDETIAKRIITRSPWEQPGWWTYASRWITEKLRASDISQTSYIVQERLCTERVVMSFDSTHGKMYFKASLGGFEASIAVFLASTKMWRKHVPFVISSDKERRWVLVHEIVKRLTMEDDGDRDGEDEGTADVNQAVALVAIEMKEAGKPIMYEPMKMAPVNGTYDLPVSRWKLFLAHFAALQMDADYRMVRFKQQGWPVVDCKEVIKRWAAMVEDLSHVVLSKDGENKVTYDGVHYLEKVEFLTKAEWETLAKFSVHIKSMFEELNASRLPPESLHFPLKPRQVFETIVKTSSPKPANMFAFFGADRGTIAHPFLGVQAIFDVWPSISGSEPGFHIWDGDFKGNDKADEIFKFRRSMRDEYLKCWKRWEKTSGCRRLFSTARRLYQAFEACRYWDMINNKITGMFDERRLRHLMSLRLKNVLEVAEYMDNHEEEPTEVEAAPGGLRPVIPWSNGTMNLQSEDGVFSRQLMIESSKVSVSDLIWDEIGFNHDQAEVKSPRVRGVYVGFDLDLHDNGIKDGDTVTFKLTMLEKVEDKDDDGRLPDVFKPWHELPPVVVYKDGMVRRPKHATLLHVNNPDYPPKQIEIYKRKVELEELRAKTLDKDIRKRRGY